MTRIYSILGVIGCLILGLDQWTKQLALEVLRFEGDSKGFLSWWSWTLVYNRAAAFGIFSSIPFVDTEAVRIGFLLAVPVVVLGLLWYFYIRKFEANENYRPAVMGLVVGGAIGNLIDRIRFQYVVDFVDWFYPSASGKCIPLFFPGQNGTTCHWPVFNIADSAISVALVLLILEPFVLKQQSANAKV
ncbi:MAG: signal peptidase II [Bdellovibrionota bacterium]